jgi:hypothetical protein
MSSIEVAPLGIGVRREISGASSPPQHAHPALVGAPLVVGNAPVDIERLSGTHKIFEMVDPRALQKFQQHLVANGRARIVGEPFARDG